MKSSAWSKPGAALVVCMAVLLAAAGDACACTGMEIRNADGSVVHGRTVEFGVEVTSAAVFVPRNYAFSGTLPDGGKGMAYTAKYACVGSVCYGIPAMLDGMNEKGLAAGAFYFPTYAGYAKVTDANRSAALSAVEFPNWILTQFATIDEVRAAVQEGRVAIVDTPVKGWGPAAPPLHYVVYDRTGRSIVLEPIDGKILVYDNPFGAITNSPTFDWQMTNLRNYINLTPMNVPYLALQGYNFYAFGQGTGMHGLPGDFTPPSRFVRAVFMSVNAQQAADAQQGVFSLFHLLNNFDIPTGLACSADDKGNLYCDRTQFTVARDPQNLRYYLRTYNDQTIRMVDLKKFDPESKEMLTLDVMGYRQAVVDISADLAAAR